MKKKMLAFLMVVLLVFGSVATASAAWQHDSRGWWYSFSNGGYARHQWLPLGNTWYVFDDDGYMVTGEAWIDGADYYFAPSGAMVTGWQKIGGLWYYFSSSGAKQYGWVKSGSNWYYMERSLNGMMVTGWKTIDGTDYYFDASGAMATGWRKIGDYWYYFASSGAAMTGWQQINGTYYYFGPTGKMFSDLTLDGYNLDSSGAWVGSVGINNRILLADTSQLTFRNRSTQAVAISFLTTNENGVISYIVADNSVVSCSWDDGWYGYTTYLYVTPLRSGSTIVYVYNNLTDEMISIPVTVR